MVIIYLSLVYFNLCVWNTSTQWHNYCHIIFQVLHKFLKPKPRNSSLSLNASMENVAHNVAGNRLPPNVSEIRRNIERYNEQQTLHNEELFGPLQNDTLIIVVQVCLIYTVSTFNCFLGGAEKPTKTFFFFNSEFMLKYPYYFLSIIITFSHS